ncbi:hypothetical protein FCV25MIE_14893 [Fagus crenata]
MTGFKDFPPSTSSPLNPQFLPSGPVESEPYPWLFLPDKNLGNVGTSLNGGLFEGGGMQESSNNPIDSLGDLPQDLLNEIDLSSLDFSFLASTPNPPKPPQSFNGKNVESAKEVIIS